MQNNRFQRLPSALRLTAISILGIWSLNGCQLVGPVAQRAATPEIMKIRPVKADKPKPPLAAENNEISKEFYPPSGPLMDSTVHTTGSHKAKEGKYTLNFDEADLSEVAKVILGDTLKLNYLINPKVTGKVSLQTARPLADDEMIPMLEMLLQMNGAVLIKSAGLYKIEPESSATINAPGTKMGLGDLGPGYQVRVVPVRYVNVQELQKVIEPLMPPKSVLRADEARNMLLLAGSAEELESIMDTIRLFDVDYMRGMSVAIFPVKNVDVPTVADELEKLLGTGSKGAMAGMLKILPIERLDAIMAISPQSEYLDDVETWLERLDRYTTNKTSKLHVYRVQNVDAADLANTLSQIFGQGGGKSGSRGASVAPGMSGSSVSGGSFGGGSSSFGGDSNSASSGLGASGFGSSGSQDSSSMNSGSGFMVDSAFAIGDTTSGANTGAGLGSSNTGSGFGSSGSGFGSSSSQSGSGFGSGGNRRSGNGRGATATELGNNARIIADPNNNALIILAKSQDYKEIEEVIKELDIMPLQVLIDATIVEVTLSDSLQFGLKWYFDHGKGQAALGSPTTAALAAAASGGFSYSLISHAQDIRVELDALASTNKVNVLSTPSVMVLNNQEAQINVGRRVPTPTGSVQNFTTTTGGVLNGSNTGGTLSSQLQYQESGVTLRVKPRVNSGGLVIMDIAQQSSDPKQVSIGGVSTYEFQQRKINSVVAVPNGETLALGGLIQDTKTDPSSISGIPIFSRIPVIGYLFGQTNLSAARTELVMLITPRVVEGRGDVARITNEFRRRMTSYHFSEPITVETLPKAPTTRTKGNAE